MAAKLILDIITDTSKAVSGLKQVSDTAGKTESKSKSSFKSMASGAAKLAGAAALGGLVAVFHTGVGEQSDFLKGQAQLAAGLKSTHGAAGTTVKGMENLASSIQGYSGQTDDSIVNAEKLLLTFTNIQNKGKGTSAVFDEATKMTADMAARMGGDASKYAVQLGKALNDPIKGVSSLTRVGVSFTDQQKQSIKTMQESGNTLGAQKVIMAELRKEFGGSAAAAGKTLPGQMARAQRSFEDLSQSLVSTFLPVLSAGAKAIGAILKFMSPGLVIAFAAAIGVLAAAFKVWQFWTVTLTAAQREFTLSLLSNPIFLIIAAIVALGIALVVAYKKSATFRKIVQAAFRVILTAAKVVVRFFTKTIPAAFTAVVNFVRKLPARLAAAGKQLWTWIVDYYKLQWKILVTLVTAAINFVKKIPGWFATAGKKIFTWIVDYYKIQWKIVVTLVSAAIDFVKKIPGRFAAAGKAIWSWLVDKFKAAWDTLKTLIGNAVDFVRKIPDRFKNAAKAIWSWLVDKFRAAWDAVKTAVGNAVNFVGRIPTKFASAAKAVWSWILDKFRAAWDGVKTAVGNAVSWIGGLGGKFKRAAGALWGWLKDGLTAAWDWCKTKFNGIVTWIGNLPARIGRAASGMWDGIKNTFQGAVNAVIGGWNNLSFTIGGWKLPFPPHTQFPSFTLNTPNIPLLSLGSGGLVNRATVALIGERGPEVVAPEPMLRQMIRDEIGNAGIHITVNGALDADAVARQIESILARRRARVAGPVRRGIGVAS